MTKRGTLSVGVLVAILLTMDHTRARDAELRFPQAVRVGDLLNRPVLRPMESRPLLGHVERVIRRADGRIQLIVRYGGFLGIGARSIAVPAEAMALVGADLEILDLVPAQLDALPTFEGGTALTLASAEIIRMGIAGPSH